MAKLLSTVPLPAPQIKSAIIELTGDEATALAVVLNNVGGNPSVTRRGLTDNIVRVLAKAVGHVKSGGTVGTFSFTT